MRKVHVVQVRVSEWHGIMELEFSRLDDHAMNLGKDFLQMTKVIPVRFVDHLVFLDKSRTQIMLMTHKIK